MPEFDSLQDLLEQAGYKETRIFTPVAMRMPSTSVDGSLNTETDQRIASTSQVEVVEDKGSSHWFSTLWPSASNNRKSSTLNRKQSEPALSKKGRKSVQKNWMGSWGSNKGSGGDVQVPPVPAMPSTYQQSEVVISTTELPSPPPQRQSLRHATSTSNLWKGSLHHHKSFPAKLREQHQQSKTISRKESFDGVGVVAGVGVGAAKTKVATLVSKSREGQRASLREAFEQEGDIDGQISTTNAEVGLPIEQDSVSSLVDLQAGKVPEKSPEKEMKQVRISAPVLVNASLFSVVATPVLSRQDAVAMRHVDCLDFAGMVQHDNNTNGVSSKGLRKMRSVDALELALARLEGQRQSSSSASFQKQATIPESFSTDSLTNEDLASANAVTTIVGDQLLSDGQFEDAPSSTAESFTEDVVMLRSSTPRLVITSPTGMRSPQPLVLEGQEFEPRSISPKPLQAIRPVATRASSSRSAMLKKPDTGEADVVAKRSVSKRRSRVIKSRGNTVDELPSMPVKAAKKRLSKSCNDLRGNAARNGMPAMSGSEQIRALQKNVLERNVIDEVGHRNFGILSDHTAVNVPLDRFDDDEDDPFSDFTALTSTKISSSSGQHRRGRDSAPADIDRKMSPIPFDHLKRRPLSSSTVNAANSVILSSRQQKMESTLSRKKSGVGLACLVQETVIRPISPRSSSLSSHGGGDENAPPSLLDSPTARVVKKRSSRIRLR
jgi:hypothetical protein